MNQNGPSEKDLYSILGVAFNAPEEAIKAAYRKQARKYHPDVNPDKKSVETFKAVSKAYEILSDPMKRRQYDSIMAYKKHKNAKPTKQAPPQPSVKSASKNESGKTTSNSFNKTFSDIFEGVFQGTTTSKQKATTDKNIEIPGSDVITEVKITEKEAMTGTKKTVNILHTERCPNCKGAKFINGAKCQICKGKGEISLHKKISIKIPQGVKSGQKIKIPGEGNKGQNGGKNGNLYLLMQVEPKGVFKFEGNNSILELPITPYESILGATIDVPTLDGRVTMKIPAGTSSGQKFKLTAQGPADSKTQKRADQIIIIKVEANKNPSEEEKNLYEKIRLCSKQRIRENLFNGI